MVQPRTQTAAAVARFCKEAPAKALAIIRDAEVPAPQPGEVLVHIHVRPINPSDQFWWAGPPAGGICKRR
jgi:NADPH:quinone reductase-like Zn-dependent oxidoreductase